MDTAFHLREYDLAVAVFHHTKHVNQPFHS
jgi:hypothetical protein